MGNTKLKKQILIDLVNYYEEIFDLLDLMINDMSDISIEDINEVIKNIPQQTYNIKNNLLTKYDKQHYKQLRLL